MSRTTERERLSRLLIVEDEEAQLRTLTDLMEDEGFVVIGCTTATEALEHVQREDFGVAVVDLRLPDLEGTRLLEKINALNHKVRVIINTAYASFDSAKEALNLGAFAYVEKAGDPTELIRHVHAAARWHLDRYAKNLESAVAARTTDLRESEERYRAIAEDTPVLVCRFLPGGEITYVNNAYCRYFEKALEELVGSSFLLRIPEADRETVLANISALTVESPTQSHEHPVIAPDGEICWQRWTNRALFDAEGKAVAYQSIGEDITERKRYATERETTIELLQLLNAKNNLHGLMRMILVFMKRLSGCEAVGIRLRDGDDFPYFQTSGFSDEFVEDERYLCERDLNGQLQRDEVGNPVLDCMCGSIICGRFDPSKPFFTENGSFVTNCTSELLATTSEADRQSRTRDRCNGEGYESVALIPLRAGGENLGLLQFNDRRKGCFSSYFVALAERLADGVGIALAQRKAEEVLRERECFLEDVFEALQDGLSVLDRDLNIVQVNGRMTRMYSHQAPLEGKKCYAAYQQRDSVCPWCPSVKAMETGETQRVEAPYPSAEEARGWIDLSAFPLKDERGGVTGVIVYVKDITERKHAEQTLQASEARYQELFDSVLEGIGVVDENEVIRLCNPAYAKIFEEDSKDALIGKNLLDYVAEHNRAFVLSQTALRRQNVPSSYELEIVTAKNHRRTIHASISPRFDEHGTYVGAFGTVMDITERKQAEQALRASEEKLRNIVEHSTNVFYSHTVDHVLTYMSPQTRSLLDCEPEECLHEWMEFITDHPVNERGFELTQAAIDTGERQPPYELELVGKKGRKVWVEAREAPLVRDGKTVAIVGALTDITERKLVEEALREKTTMLDNILRSARDVAIATTDLDFRITYYNPMAKEFFGYTAAEVIGKTVMEMHTKEKVVPERFESAIEVVRRDGYYGYSVTQETENGPRYLDSWVAGVLDSDGTLIGYSLFSRDITERRRVEEALRKERDFSTTLLQSSPTFFVAISAEGRTLMMNETMLTSLGYAEDEVVGTNYLKTFVPESDRELLAEVFKRLVQSNEATLNENRILTKDGRELLVEWHGRSIFKENGEFDFFFGAGLDITARKRAEEERVRLMSAIEQAAETVVITDVEGTIQYANPAFERVTGYSREEALGQNPRILKSGKHDDAFYREMWNMLTRGETWRGRFTNKRKDDILFQEDAVISPVRDSIGAIVSYVAVKRDVTKEVALEAQLRQAQKMEAIGQLAGGVAHDFNNLLTTILGNSEVLLSAVAEKAAATSQELLRPGLEQIQSAGKQAASLTRQLLAFSRRETTTPQVLDPQKLVGEMEELLRRLIGEHIELDVRLSAQTCFIHADPGQIEQIVMNLVVNAADAMPKGGRLDIRVEDAELDEPYVADHADAKPGRHVVLSVADNGTGMTPDTLEHMFEPFFTTKPVSKGTGLGLATVYGTVKQLGGHIRVDSNPGVGSTFTVYLPVVDKRESKKEPDVEPTRSGAGESILVCEDQGMVRDVMCKTLRAGGYAVIEADNGERALEATSAHQGTIDLLISDVMMPGMSGTELADRLAPEHPKMRVLFVSGYAADHLDAHGMGGGAVELLQKPFGPTALLRRVREVLDAERSIG